MRSVKKILATALAVAMVTSVSVPVMAAEVPVAEEQVVVLAGDSAENPDEGIMPLAQRIIYLTNAFDDIPCSFGTNGGTFTVIVNEDVTKSKEEMKHVDFDPSKYQMDIRMYGRNGLLWGEDDCLHNTSGRMFQCSSEVTYIHLRIIPRPKLIFTAPIHSFEVQLVY